MNTPLYEGRSVDQLRYFGAGNEDKSWFDSKPWLKT